MKYKGHTIYKRKDKRWSCTIREKNKYKYIYGKTQQDCLNKLKEYFKTNKKENITKIANLNQWTKKWIETYKLNKIKPSTLKTYNNLIKNHITNSIGKLNLSNLKPIDIQEHLTKISKNTPRQAQKVYDLLCDIFNKAEENNYLEKGFAKKIEKPEHQKKPTNFLSINQQKQFIKYCNKTNNVNTDFLLILLNQGLRISELLNIHNEDINFDNKTITIKERQEKNIYLKTKTSIRTIPMINNTNEILNKYKTKKERIFNISDTPIYNELKKINKELNINITPHSLRHTFITRLKEKNIPEHIIQMLVGHKIGSKITSQTYTHFDNNYFNSLNLNF